METLRVRGFGFRGVIGEIQLQIVQPAACNSCIDGWVLCAPTHAQNYAIVGYGAVHGAVWQATRPWHDLAFQFTATRLSPGQEFGKNWIKGSPDIQQDNYQNLGPSKRFSFW